MHSRDNVLLKHEMIEKMDQLEQMGDSLSHPQLQIAQELGLVKAKDTSQSTLKDRMHIPKSVVQEKDK